MRNLFARKRNPTPLHGLYPGADDRTQWGWGLFAGAVVVSLLGLAVILEDDAYLVEMSVQAEAAYFDGLMEGYQRGRAYMRDQMVDAWHPGALDGELGVDCTLPATPAQAAAERRTGGAAGTARAGLTQARQP